MLMELDDILLEIYDCFWKNGKNSGNSLPEKLSGHIKHLALNLKQEHI